MSLEPVGEMMGHARRHGYAVGYFESWSIDSLCGVIDAAEASRSPVIIGFNGEFMSHAGRVAGERISLYGALGKAAAESAGVPCGLIFNECARDDWTRTAVTAGFNLVMPADATASYDEYQRRVADLAQYAHAHGVAIEAELGELPSGVGHEASHASEKTDPELARDFVAATGVDLLAVSVGNVHIALAGRTALDLDHLRAIRRSVEVPLILHGGTGIADDSLRQAVAMGVTKVNYGTGLKQHYLAAVRRALANDEPNPHVLLGLGGLEDVMVAGRLAVRDAVAERLPTLGCVGRA